MEANEKLEEELASFRQQWHEELYESESQEYAAEKESSVFSSSKNNLAEKNQEHEAAQLFMKGTSLEKDGNFNAAVYYYREAIRLVPDIEFKMAEYQTKNPNCDKDNEEEEVIEELQDKYLESITKQLNMLRVSGLCLPELPQRITHISALPTELLMLVIKCIVTKDLDVKSLVQFSSVCKWFYACARDEELWKLICIRVWGVNSSTVHLYNNSWRTMFFRKPRLQYDGVYISENSYVRIGEQGVDSFYKPFHIVEYFKYLRFFTDGSCLIYTSSDEPQIVVHTLHSPPYREGNIYKGFWRLNDENGVNVFYTHVTKPTQYEVQRKRRNNRDYKADIREHNFYLKLRLTNTKKKSNNKLTWDSYTCQVKHCATGQVLESDIGTSSFRPFIFSSVRSYCSKSLSSL